MYKLPVDFNSVVKKMKRYFLKMYIFFNCSRNF